MITFEVKSRFNTRIVGEQRKAAWQLVLLAANIVRTQAVMLTNKPAKRIRKRRRRTTSKGPKGSQYTVFVGSRPGEPPQVRRGHGRKSIALEPFESQLLVRLGVRRNAAYMAYLETGTRHVAPRPWMLPALNRSQQQIKVLRLGK